jgi:hypothetical protein
VHAVGAMGSRWWELALLAASSLVWAAVALGGMRLLGSQLPGQLLARVRR